MGNFEIKKNLIKTEDKTLLHKPITISRLQIIRASSVTHSMFTNVLESYKVFEKSVIRLSSCSATVCVFTLSVFSALPSVNFDNRSAKKKRKKRTKIRRNRETGWLGT